MGLVGREYIHLGGTYTLKSIDRNGLGVFMEDDCGELYLISNDRFINEFIEKGDKKNGIRINKKQCFYRV